MHHDELQDSYQVLNNYQWRVTKASKYSLYLYIVEHEEIETYKILSDYNENIIPILKINTSSTRGNTLKLLKSMANKANESSLSQIE